MCFECLGKEYSRAQKHKTALRDHLLFCIYISYIAHYLGA